MLAAVDVRTFEAMITDLHFENFRGFADLRLEGLKRVNLVVGRNNAGKTSLLEGVAIATGPQRLNEMQGVLRASIGNPPQRYHRWLVRDREGINAAALEVKGPNTNCKVALSRQQDHAERFPKDKWMQVYFDGALFGYAKPVNDRVNCRVVPLQQRQPHELVRFFTQAVKKKGGEEQLEKYLRMVDDRIKKIRVEPAEDGNHIMIDLGLSEMLPLPQAGQGVYHLVAIFSELIGDTPRLCIIDEIENGIHHSLLEQVWAGLAVVAEELDIQLFITTHSQECIEAAHAAFSKRKEYDFSIVQLFRVPEGVQGRVLDRKHIEAAMAGEIDLR